MFKKSKYLTLILTLSFLNLWSLLTHGQVTTLPALPTANQSVVITLNAANTELEGYTGEVYAHTGVNILGGSNWQYVIESWGNNSTQPKLTRIGTDLYELHITPSIREFYGVPANQTIRQIAIVFRSESSPYLQTRPDIFIDVVQAGLTVSILSPVGMQPVVSLNDQVNIDVAANEADSVAIFLNGEWKASTTGQGLVYPVTATASGRFDILARAYRETETTEASSYFFVKPEVTTAELPEGVVPGINYIDDTTVTLVLHDPPAKKEYAFVIADFNDWGVGEENFMKRTPDGQYFWTTVTGLTPGREYAYQYLLDGDLRIADPYTEKVLEPFLDNEIRDQGRYPGLIPYPTGKTLLQVSVLQPAREPYQWQHNDFVPPAVEDLVVYELLIRDFLGANNNTYAGLRDTLAYLKRLGVNAIELMPVTDFDGNLSWGYNPAFYFAADKYYGPRRELKKFIDEAHGMGIAVILDMVWNHSFGQSPLLRMYFDAQGNKPHPDNPWYSDYIFANSAMNFGYKFDHGSPYFIEFMDRANRHWLENYRVDGFRFDLSKGFTTRYKGTNDEWGSNFDQERIDNLIRLNNTIKAVNPDAYVILEHLAGNQEETILANNGMLLWGNITHTYQEAAMGWTANSNFDWISYLRRGWNDPHLIGYMESHDEERIMYKNITFGNSTNAQHDIKQLPVALRRGELVAAFYFTVPGPKMVWQFGELGYDYSIDFNGRVGNKPVRWDYYNDPNRRRLHDVYAALIRLKRENEVFSTRNFSMSTAGAMKRIHLNHESNQVTVLGNFGVTIAPITPNFQKTGTWYEFFSGQTYEVGDVNQIIQLQPGEYRIYSSVRFEGDNPLNVLPPKSGANAEIDVFPNPSLNGFTFSWDGPAFSAVSLEIFDLSGRRLFGQYLPFTAERSLFWDGTGDNREKVGNGIYLYSLQAGEKVYSGKIIVQ